MLLFRILILLLMIFIQPIWGKVKVITTLTVLETITNEVGKDRVEVSALIPADVDPHFADARPDYVMKLNQADLLVYIGLDLEIGWLPKLIEQSRNPRIYLGKPGNCDVSKDIYVLEKPTTRVDRSLGDIHIYGNPHYWLDPVNAVIIARNIKNHLVEIDPDNQNYYENNYLEYAKKIKNLTLDLSKQYQRLKSLKVAVYHKEYKYFIERFGLNEVVSLEEKPGVPPSASYLKEVVERIKKENVKLIFIAPYNDPKYANFVSKETGTKVVVIPTTTSKNIKTYEDLMKSIFSNIENAL